MSCRPTTRLGALLGMGITLTVASGCATKGFVRKEISGLEARAMPAVEQAENRARQAQNLAESVDGRAQQALHGAEQARELALGNVRLEEVRRVTVSFAFDSAELPEGGLESLDGVVHDLRSNANYVALIGGHTDATGDEGYNFELAERRAAAVQRHLALQLGLEFARLSTNGYGEVQPVSDNETPEGREQNRRVDVVLARPVPARTAEAPPTAAR